MNDKLQEVVGRVVDEHTLLDEKVRLLDNFLNSSKATDIGNEQGNFLIIQLSVMKSYRTILEMRLLNFNN